MPILRLGPVRPSLQPSSSTSHFIRPAATIQSPDSSAFRHANFGMSSEYPVLGEGMHLQLSLCRQWLAWLVCRLARFFTSRNERILVSPTLYLLTLSVHKAIISPSVLPLSLSSPLFNNLAMFASIKSSTLTLLSLSILIRSTPTIANPTQCKNNQLLSLIQRFSTFAHSFCSSYLRSPCPLPTWLPRSFSPARSQAPAPATRRPRLPRVQPRLLSRSASHFLAQRQRRR